MPRKRHSTVIFCEFSRNLDVNGYQIRITSLRILGRFLGSDNLLVKVLWKRFFVIKPMTL